MSGAWRPSLPAWAQKTVTFAYQDMMNPFRWVQQTGEIEKATGYKINWRQFGGGGDVIRAMASGDVAIGEVGSRRRRDRDQPGHGRRAVLDPRGHRGGRGAGRAQRQRRQHDRRSQGQEDRHAVRVDVALPAAVRAGARRDSSATDAQVLNMRPPEIAAAWAARRHRRDVHLGPGARHGQEERQGADHLRRASASRATARSTA